VGKNNPGTTVWNVRFRTHCGRWLRFGELRDPANSGHWHYHYHYHYHYRPTLSGRFLAVTGPLPRMNSHLHYCGRELRFEQAEEFASTAPASVAFKLE